MNYLKALSCTSKEKIRIEKRDLKVSISLKILWETRLNEPISMKRYLWISPNKQGDVWRASTPLRVYESIMKYDERRKVDWLVKRLKESTVKQKTRKRKEEKKNNNKKGEVVHVLIILHTRYHEWPALIRALKMATWLKNPTNSWSLILSKPPEYLNYAWPDFH